MAMPSINDLLLPFLRIMDDEKIHYRIDMINQLADQFNLSEEERLQRDTNNNLVFGNLIDWCRSYFISAQFIQNTENKGFRITRLGSEQLRDSPAQINVQYLRQFFKG